MIAGPFWFHGRDGDGRTPCPVLFLTRCQNLLRRVWCGNQMGVAA